MLGKIFRKPARKIQIEQFPQAQSRCPDFNKRRHPEEQTIRTRRNTNTRQKLLLPSHSIRLLHTTRKVRPFSQRDPRTKQSHLKPKPIKSSHVGRINKKQREIYIREMGSSFNQISEVKPSPSKDKINQQKYHYLGDQDCQKQ